VRITYQDFLLVTTAAVWGTAFVSQRLGVDHMGPAWFNAIRFLSATPLLIPVLWFRGEPPSRTVSRKNYLGGGALIGFLLFLGAYFQQWGLETTDASKAGFLTSLYVVIVPLLWWCVGRKPHRSSLIGATLCAVGAYFISVSGRLVIERGDVLIALCGAIWAIHFIALGILTQKIDVFWLSFFQFAVTGVLSLGLALTTEPTPSLESVRAALPYLVHCGVLSIAIGYTFQVWAQKRISPDRAAIILSLEAVFAAIAGSVWLGETMGPRVAFGCTLVFVGVLATELGARKEK